MSKILAETIKAIENRDGLDSLIARPHGGRWRISRALDHGDRSRND